MWQCLDTDANHPWGSVTDSLLNKWDHFPLIYPRSRSGKETCKMFQKWKVDSWKKNHLKTLVCSFVCLLAWGMLLGFFPWSRGKCQVELEGVGVSALATTSAFLDNLTRRAWKLNETLFVPSCHFSMEAIGLIDPASTARLMLILWEMLKNIIHIYLDINIYLYLNIHLDWWTESYLSYCTGACPLVSPKVVLWAITTGLLPFHPLFLQFWIIPERIFWWHTTLNVCHKPTPTCYFSYLLLLYITLGGNKGGRHRKGGHRFLWMPSSGLELTTERGGLNSQCRISNA